MDRAKAGANRHVIIDACGTPLVVWCTPANRGYRFPWRIEAVREAEWLPMLSPRGQGPRDAASSRGRYVVERTLAWFGGFRRLKFCYERWGVHYRGFHELASVAINFKRLQTATARRL